MSDVTQKLQVGASSTDDGTQFATPVEIVDAAGNPASLAGPAGPAGPTGPAGKAGSNGVGVRSISLTKDANGAITGGTWVGTDGKSNPITVSTTAAGDEQPAESTSPDTADADAPSMIE